MHEYFVSLTTSLVIFSVIEIPAIIIFIFIRWKMGGDGVGAKPILESFKGLLERLVLFIGLMINFPQVLIFFGALKIGARLSAEKNTDAGNNYFIVGNLISILFVFAAYSAASQLNQVQLECWRR